MTRRNLVTIAACTISIFAVGFALGQARGTGQLSRETWSKYGLYESTDEMFVPVEDATLRRFDPTMGTDAFTKPLLIKTDRPMFVHLTTEGGSKIWLMLPVGSVVAPDIYSNQMIYH